MKFVDYVTFEANPASRIQWWGHADMPERFRKGNPYAQGYMWWDREKRCYHWLPKEEFENRYEGYFE